ncbi:MAG: ketoacyl-ACP synthase III [Saprospiraceae bacterium]|jgi:3-oxoacyl-[acyl-carrier-protein] synthase-3|nr:ketoacyl-ACP synthase III [Saprospiraceae bacterium]MBP6445955.1 ketoacyl-ACP synthase III [Saprospiraceae bacterium]
MLRTVITGTGSYIPEAIVSNDDFIKNKFYSEDGNIIESPSHEIIKKFEDITGISERRYVSEELMASDLGYIAAKKAIEDANIDPETLDQIIVAHNYGDVAYNSVQTDAVPALASRIKQKLGIINPSCIAYDILFGCPGWLQGVIHSDAFFKAGIARKILVIGAEALSRVIDPYDRDSMIFSDGAGATVLEYVETHSDSGIIASAVQSHCVQEANYINFGESYRPDSDPSIRYIKMKGRKVYEYAIKNVPLAMKYCVEKSEVDVRAIKKIFIHQANEKMDEGIIKMFYRLYGIKDIPNNIMPMNIHKNGNSSVATIPTLFDYVKHGWMDDHELKEGDIIMFASVGAGMNINAATYRM